MSQSDSRNPQDDPRVGDVLQVIPPFGHKVPKPMTVLAVDDKHITWTRGDGSLKTPIKQWRRRQRMGGGERFIVFADTYTGDKA